MGIKKNTVRHKISKALYNYKDLKYKIKIRLDNVKFYQEELKKLFEGKETIITKDWNTDDVSRVIDRLRMSEVERDIINKESRKPADSKYIKELIDIEKRHIKNYRAIIRAIDNVLNTLTKKQRFLIEISYIDKNRYNWKQILENYNTKFNKEITNENTLVAMKCRAMDKIEEELKNNCRIMNYF